MTPRIVVLGAGSVGCFVGGLWKHHGLDITFVGRSSAHNTIAASGLRLSGIGGLDVRLEPPAMSFGPSPEVLAEAELVALAVKSVDTRQAAAEIAAHATADAAVLSLQNGISNIDILRQALPGRAILRGMVGFNVAWLGDGHLHRGTSGRLVAERHPLTEALATTLRGTPAELELSDDALSLAWGKLLLNLNNAVNALSGKTLHAELSERSFRRVLAASMREALTVMAAAGISPARAGPLPPALLPRFVAAPDFVFNTIGLRLQKIDRDARSSMADDFAAGRPTEIEFLNGEIARLAHAAGQRAPVNETIMRLVREAERGGKRDWAGDELLEKITGA